MGSYYTGFHSDFLTIADLYSAFPQPPLIEFLPPHPLAKLGFTETPSTFQTQMPHLQHSLPALPWLALNHPLDLQFKIDLLNQVFPDLQI